MEPISALATSLALGAAAIAGKEVVSAAATDAHSTLKGLLKSRYPKVSVDHLEQAPASTARRAGVEEELTAASAHQDAELVAAARKLIELVQQDAPGVAAAIGVDLKEVSAANLRLADVEAAGTGSRMAWISLPAGTTASMRLRKRMHSWHFQLEGTCRDRPRSAATTHDQYPRPSFPMGSTRDTSNPHVCYHDLSNVQRSIQ